MSVRVVSPCSHHTSRRRRGLVHGVAVLLTLALVGGPAGTLAATYTNVGPGIFYMNERITNSASNMPWSIHVVRFERSRKNLELHSTLAQGTILGLARLSDQVRAMPPAAGRPVAAINGDFYAVDRATYAGDPRGLQILDGELVSGPGEQCTFWLDAQGEPQATNVISAFQATWPDGSTTALGLNEERPSGKAVLFTPRLGPSTLTVGGRELILEPAGSTAWLPLRAEQTYVAKVREVRAAGDTPLRENLMVLSLSPELDSVAAKVEAGATVKISTATIPSLAGVQFAIGGGYVVVREGKPARIDLPQSGAYKYRTVNEPHPRAAIGASKDHIYLFEVDGRQRAFSMGMTLPQLGEYMAQLGCDMALNLDGGASATFWLNGKMINKPSSGRERVIANGVVLTVKPGGESNP